MRKMAANHVLRSGPLTNRSPFIYKLQNSWYKTFGLPFLGITLVLIPTPAGIVYISAFTRLGKAISIDSMRSNCLSNENHPPANRRDASTGWTSKCADNEWWLIPGSTHLYTR